MDNQIETSNLIKALHQATLSLMKRVPVNLILKQILESARPLVGAKYAAIGIFDDKEEMTQFITTGLDLPANHKMPIPSGSKLLKNIYQKNKTMRINHLENEGYIQHLPPGHPQMHNFLGVPITAENLPIGTLYLTDKLNEDGTPIPFSQIDQELIEMFAAHAGVAWQNARLYQKMNHMIDHYYQKAVTDELTGLFNRRRFDELMQKEIDRANRYERPLTLILLDIDHFKKVNDTYGHLVGDEILRHITYLMLHNVRQFDTVCRFGGEEFTIILPESTLDGGILLAERLRIIIANTPFIHKNKPIQLTASFGVVQLTKNSSYKDILSAVDKAMYQAKNNGRNQVVSTPLLL